MENYSLTDLNNGVFKHFNLMKKILVIGQTPPPYHGQALSTERLLKGEYEDVHLIHLNVKFSSTIDEIGKFKLSKVFTLFTTIVLIFFKRFRFQPSTIYYMPACSGKIPFYRDYFILILTRWLFKRTIFHFRSAGIDEVYKDLNKVERFLFRLSYYKPDLAIQLSEKNPSDGDFINAKKTVIVPNGISDLYPSFKKYKNENEEEIKILSIGSIRESKGVLDLITACSILNEKHNFKLLLAGQFVSEIFRDRVESKIKELELDNYVKVLGEITGEGKWRIFAESQIFCFPTFYENESFGNVLIEAMQFELPVVATDWRATSTIVDEGITGYLVPINKPKMLADRISYLIDNPDDRKRMGRAGREKFLSQYNIQAFWKNMELAFKHINE